MWHSGRALTLSSVAVNLVHALLPIAAIYAARLLVDVLQVTPGAPSPGVTQVLPVVGLAAAVMMAMAVFRALAGWIRIVQGQAVSDHVFELVHRQSVAVDLAYYEDARFFDTLHLAQQEGGTRPIEIMDAVLQVLRNGISLLAVGAILASFHWAVVAALVAVAVPGGMIRAKFGTALYRWRKQATEDERRASYLHWLMVDGGTAAEIRLLGLGRYLQGRFRELRRTIRRARIDHATRHQLSELVFQVGAIAVVFGVFVYMVRETLEGSRTLGDLIMYFLALQRGQEYLMGLLDSLGRLYEGCLFLESIDRFLAIPTSSAAAAEAPPSQPAADGGLSAEHLSFTYPGTGREILHDIDVRIDAGTMVALVGANGSGKSTLIKLMCRLYEPDAGRIALAGRDIRMWAREEWQSRLGVLLQDFARYHLSGRDNIGVGDIDRAEQHVAIEAAARTSGIHQILQGLPKGYETILGRMFKEGIDLSVGQWQRIALARILFRNTDIVILDEPTSSLDVYAEHEIFGGLRTLLAGRTVLVVSHRLATVRSADRILVMDGGRIVEQGTHDQLMRRDGTYSRMFRLQADSYRTGDQPCSA